MKGGFDMSKELSAKIQNAALKSSILNHAFGFVMSHMREELEADASDTLYLIQIYLDELNEELITLETEVIQEAVQHEGP